MVSVLEESTDQDQQRGRLLEKVQPSGITRGSRMCLLWEHSYKAEKPQAVEGCISGWKNSERICQDHKVCMWRQPAGRGAWESAPEPGLLGWMWRSMGRRDEQQMTPWTSSDNKVDSSSSQRKPVNSDSTMLSTLEMFLIYAACLPFRAF